jgi:hypothetical protein
VRQYQAGLLNRRVRIDGAAGVVVDGVAAGEVGVLAFFVIVRLVIGFDRFGLQRIGCLARRRARGIVMVASTGSHTEGYPNGRQDHTLSWRRR